MDEFSNFEEDTFINAAKKAQLRADELKNRTVPVDISEEEQDVPIYSAAAERIAKERMKNKQTAAKTANIETEADIDAFLNAAPLRRPKTKPKTEPKNDPKSEPKSEPASSERPSQTYRREAAERRRSVNSEKKTLAETIHIKSNMKDEIIIKYTREFENLLTQITESKITETLKTLKSDFLSLERMFHKDYSTFEPAMKSIEDISDSHAKGLINLWMKIKQQFYVKHREQPMTSALRRVRFIHAGAGGKSLRSFTVASFQSKDA